MIGWHGGEGVGRQAEGAADRTRATVAGGENVNVGVTHHEGLSGCNRFACDSAGLSDESEKPVGVGLLGVEAVAAVVLEEKAVEAEVSADVARGVDGLVGEDRHQDIGMGCADGFEGCDNASVDIGVIEFVDAVVVEKEGQGIGHVLLVVDVSFRIAESAADEHRGPVSYIAGDDRLGELRFAEVSKHGVD